MAALTAAIGFSAHSGWTAMVVVGGTAAAPILLARSRVTLIDDCDPDSKQPYHAVEFLCVEEATGRLDGYFAVAKRLASAALESLFEELGARGYRVRAAGVLESSSRKQIVLSSILASHALIHAADGDHFRNALAGAAEEHRLPVSRVPARALDTFASERLRKPAARLLDTVNDMGRAFGPPWGADQKNAALLAWCLLRDAAG
jgi:hypothetical protein